MLKSIINKLFKGKSNALSFQQGFDLTELPIITFKQGDTKLNFILDTGATNNVIDSNALPNIKYTPMNEVSTLFGLEGNVKPVQMCRLALSHKDFSFEYEYLINDLSAPFLQIKKESGVILHGILGSKFFHKFQYVLDFSELIAYSKK